ncbi:hypothetical protein EVAR_66428_1 [Eumeta japonica]|uniref:Uncharacterized protein n=1 Tax=Eumeta variegata TaxID=151549 RepID=A0A4C1ZJ01_EUMVA|nr:hypothetical protein EVAR_66428_1 [Eumeta japonica]
MPPIDLLSVLIRVSSNNKTVVPTAGSGPRPAEPALGRRETLRETVPQRWCDVTQPDATTTVRSLQDASSGTKRTTLKGAPRRRRLAAGRLKSQFAAVACRSPLKV